MLIDNFVVSQFFFLILASSPGEVKDHEILENDLLESTMHIRNIVPFHGGHIQFFKLKNIFSFCEWEWDPFLYRFNRSKIVCIIILLRNSDFCMYDFFMSNAEKFRT